MAAEAYLFIQSMRVEQIQLSVGLHACHFITITQNS